MSYEGYDQILCEQGHYNTLDCNEHFDPETWTCVCGSKPVWWNPVNLTNGSYCSEDGIACPGCVFCDHGRIDGYVELEIDKDRCAKPCPCCGHVQKLLGIAYKIPEGKGHRIE